MLCACNSASPALSFPQFCHYTSFRLHDLPPFSLLRSFSLSFPRVWQQETITLTDGISLLQFLSVCLPSSLSLSLTRSPSCAFAVLFPPTHSAPSLLLFRAVFSWVDVIGIYRTLPERERERELTYTAEWKTDSPIHQSKHTALHRSNQDQHNRSEPSTTQHNGANKHSTNDITPEQTSTKQYMQANKHNTEQTNMILHKKNYNIVNKNATTD